MVKRLIAEHRLDRADGLKSILRSHYLTGYAFFSFQGQKEYRGLREATMKISTKKLTSSTLTGMYISCCIIQVIN